MSHVHPLRRTITSQSTRQGWTLLHRSYCRRGSIDRSRLPIPIQRLQGTMPRSRRRSIPLHLHISLHLERARAQQRKHHAARDQHARRSNGNLGLGTQPGKILDTVDLLGRGVAIGVLVDGRVRPGARPRVECLAVVCAAFFVRVAVYDEHGG